LCQYIVTVYFWYRPALFAWKYCN